MRRYGLALGSVGALWIAACSSSGSSGSSCQNESDAQLCARLRRDCDLVTASDQCGISRTVNCGDCTAPATCGGGGTQNVCGTPAGNPSPADAGGDAPSTTDAGGADACTFTCPTRAHSIATSVNFTYSSKGSCGTDDLHPLVGENVALMISFDEGASFKKQSSSSYDLAISLSNVDVQTSGDTSGVLDQIAKSSLAGKTGTLTLSYGTQTSAQLAIGASYDWQLFITCQPLVGATVGADQYVVPGPFQCSNAFVQIVSQSCFNNVIGRQAQGTAATVSYQ